MRRLLISDLHLHSWSYGGHVVDGGWNGRLWGQWLALENVLNYVEEHGIKWLYFNGDLFHTPGNIPTQALQIASSFFAGLKARGCTARLLIGNHDMASKDGYIHGLSFLDDGTNIAYPGVARRWEDDGLNVRAMGYTESGGKVLNFLDACQGRGGIVLLHQGVAGVPLSSGYIVDECLTPDMIPDDVFAFTGHYHFHRRVTTNLTVIGNLTPLTWSDIDQEKGFIVWDDETYDLEFVPQVGAQKFLSYTPDSEVEVEGNFIRYANEVEPKEMAGIRTDLIEQGAAAVEFPHVKMNNAVSIQTGVTFDVEKIAASVIDSDMEPRRKEVGVEVREGKYST